MGRPKKCTPEVRERVVQAILANAPQDVAAARGGIAESTHYDWMAKGQALLEQHDHADDVPESDRPLAEYSEAVTDARREWELRQLAIIARGAAGVPTDGVPWETRTTRKTVRELNPATGEIVEFVAEETVVERRGLPGNTADAKWMLERRLQDRYGRVWRAEVTTPEGAPISVSLDEKVEKLSGLVDELAARRQRRIEHEERRAAPPAADAVTPGQD